MYVDMEFYKNSYGGQEEKEEIQKFIARAEKQIDTLTFCRINGIGFSKLTPFQQEQVKYATCLQADFIHDNKDEIETMLASYSVNGVSMTFQTGENVKRIQNILIRSDIYAELEKTGLCCRKL